MEKFKRVFSRRILLLVIFIILPPFFTLYAWIAVLFVVPPIPETPSIITFFGSGLGLASFCILFMFLFSTLFRFAQAGYFFHDSNKTTAILIYSSPISLPKLALGCILSEGVIEWWYCAWLLEFYILYRLAKGLPLQLVNLILISSLVLITSLTAACFGFYLRYVVFNKSKKFFKEIFPLSTILIFVCTILIVVLALLSRIPDLYVFSPLGWISIGMYSLFSDNNLEFLLTIVPSALFLVFSLFLLYKMDLISEIIDFSSFQPLVLPSYFKFFQNLSCKPFSGKKRQLAKLLFIEEWKSKRPYKFLIVTFISLILFLIFSSNYSFVRYLPQFLYPDQAKQVALIISSIFSISLPLIPLIHNELGYSLFNYEDKRFSFFRSTPTGIRSIAKIKLFFIFFWYIPFLFILGVLITFLSSSSVLILITLATGILSICIDFGVHCYRPSYFMSNLDVGGIYLALLIIVVVNIFLAGSALLATTLFLNIVPFIFYFIFTIIISFITIKKGIQKLEKMEMLI
ncbi:MAG: hypothetical protein ACFFDI_06340 [Promethearchaeota archaeon]